MNILFLLFFVAPSLQEARQNGYSYQKPKFGSHFGEDPISDAKELKEGNKMENRIKREDIIVSTKLGQLRGQLMSSRKGEKFAAFTGIPYAETPERFEPAKPVKSWSGIKDALNYSQVCPQFLGWNGLGSQVIGSEDCLYLNVYFPNSQRCLNKNEPNKLPVIFHIHGGAYVEGSGGKFGPDYFMDECVVFVSINYRLGALGFLSTDDGRIPGNLGLKDQLVALRWTRDNIEYFNGDPDSVTISGVSAGSASVSFLIASPAAKGLFSKAIAGSGSALNPWAIIKNPGERARILGQQVNCPNTKSTLELKSCLKSVDFKQLVIYQEQNKKWNSDPHSISSVIERPTSLFDPDYEPFQTRDPYILLKNGDFNKVPLITGFVQEEGNLLKAGQIINNKTTLAELNSSDWFKIAPISFYYERLNRRRKIDMSRKIRSFYFGNDLISTKTFDNLTHLHSDRMFVMGVIKMADLHSKFAPVYSYVFNFSGPLSFTSLLLGYKEPVVSHADDYFYLYRIAEVPEHKKGSREEKFSQNFVKLWTSFAKEGKPLAQNWESRGVEWPLYRKEERKYLKLDENLEILDDYLKSRIDFWDNSQISLDEFPQGVPTSPF